MLWKQILGFSIFTIVLQIQHFYYKSFSLLDILWILLGIFTFCDAWSSGIYKKKDVKSLINVSPMGWGIAIQLLTVVAYPLYLANRNKLKTQSNNNIFFVFTIISGILALVLFVWAISVPNILRVMGK